VRLNPKPTSDRFEAIATLHLDAAYSLARWLTRDSVLAEDVVQDAMLRALKYFEGFRGENPRAWLLQIVRNVALGKLNTRRTAPISLDDPDEALGDALSSNPTDPSDEPEYALQQEQDRERAQRLLEDLPTELRECLVLRELEECSYKEIARIVDAPIGTVMSRLWRARQWLAKASAEREDAYER
jgi:RNA polymerase sigma-70 factor (ECF subfamily)